MELQRRSLPLFEVKEALLNHIERHWCTILVGETGSGKTTQVPQYLLEAGVNRKLIPTSGSKRRRTEPKTPPSNPIPRPKKLSAHVIGCTQPRRVAAVTVAQRVAKERGTDIGAEVGYTVRFDDTSSASTKIKFLTDGMLLREAMADPLLRKYSILILDEAHERTVHTRCFIRHY